MRQRKQLFAQPMAVWRSGSRDMFRSPKSLSRFIWPRYGFVHDSLSISSREPGQTSGCPQHLIARDRGGAIGFPGPAVPSDRNDRLRAALKDRGMTAAFVGGSVRYNCHDILGDLDLRHQLRQDRAVALSAGGELDSTDFTCRGAVTRSTFRHFGPCVAPCLRASHSPSPRKRMSMSAKRLFRTFANKGAAISFKLPRLVRVSLRRG